MEVYGSKQKEGRPRPLARLQAGLRWPTRRWERRLARSLWAVAGLYALFFLVNALWPLPTQVRYGTLVRARDGHLLHAFLSPDDKWRLHAPLATLPPELTRALVHKEDRWFAWHPGVNPLALLRAAWRNAATGRRTSGASTITMQVVRLLEPRPRTYASKVAELARAVQLEFLLSKNEILELYLNLLPYGGNVEGVEAAARVYLGQPPEALSLAQITLLAVVPNRPGSLRPGPGAEARLRAARDAWLRRFGAAGLFAEGDVAAALQEPLAWARRALPREAPHLALRLRAAQPTARHLHTTLDANFQARTETLLAAHVARLRSQNISNAAALVVDNATGQVLAYVGSAQFADAGAAGQVDGVRALRSPGSALKPLLYALAFDRGLATPRTQLLDVPTAWAGYAPENYDRTCHGLVPMADALAASLNIPAVRLLETLSPAVFASALHRAGFAAIAPDGRREGLSLALGGCGVRLEEMARLYAGLARQGALPRLSYLLNSQRTAESRAQALPNAPFRANEKTEAGATSAHEVRIVSPAAAYVITQVLTQVARPDLPNNFQNAATAPRIAWKTGTSYGRRDAWAIGYDARHTVAVWVGNFRGEGAPALSGADVATPLLFALFPPQGAAARRQWLARPAGLAQRPVCAATGLPPGEHCEATVLDDFLPGTSPTARCAHLRYVWVNPTAPESYCARCLPAQGAERRLYPAYAPELLAWYKLEGLPVQTPPPHRAGCAGTTAAEGGLRIAAPADGAEFYIDRAAPRPLALEAHADGAAGRLHWFANGRYLGERAPTERLFYTPDTGRTLFSVTDDRGRQAQVAIRVHGF